jgi:MFS family permease
MIRLVLALGLGQTGFHAWVASIPVAMHAVGRPDGEIGVVVGSAALFHIFASLGSGGLIDRYGGRAIYLAGCAALGLAALPIAVNSVNAESPFGVWLVIRLLQGAGLAAVLPAIQTMVPDRVAPANLPTALATVGLAGNVSLALTPPLSLLLLERFGLQSVGIAVVISVAAGALLLWLDQQGRQGADPTDETRTLRRLATAFRPAWRPAWAAPLLCTFLFIAHWGVVTGYIAQHAAPSGADIGLFFTGDAVGLLVLRIPGGWLAGRIRALWLVLTGVAITCSSLALLLLPPTTALLIAAGFGTGMGAALFLPVMLVELTRRSDATDRGSAFGLYSVAFGLAIAGGSLGTAPFYESIGFATAMAAGIVVCASAGFVALTDRTLRRSPTEWLALAESGAGG